MTITIKAKEKSIGKMAHTFEVILIKERKKAKGSTILQMAVTILESFYMTNLVGKVNINGRMVKVIKVIGMRVR